MNQMRGLMIAAALLVVLSGLVFLSKKHKAAEAAKPPSDAAPKILSIDDKQVKEVEIDKPGADPVVISKLGDKWEITKPMPMAADQDSVATLVTTASSLTADRLIDDKASGLSQFGLQDPATKIAIRLKNGKTDTLDIGADAPGGSATYAKLEGDPRVFSIATYNKTSLAKNLNDVRDKRLLTFDRDKLSRVEMTNGKGQTVEFGKNAQGDWQILKPEPMRADGSQVDELVRKLGEAKILPDSGKISPQTFGAAAKLASISATDNSGTQTAEIRQDKDKVTYAKSSAVDGIYKIDNDLAANLTKSADDFRNKKLFDFGFSELSQVTAQGTTYTRSGEKWVANGKEMDSSSVLNLLDKLRDLAATGFAKAPSGSKVFEAAVTTSDKKRSETVSITRSGTANFAQRQGEPAVYTLDASAVDELIKAAADIKPTAPAKPSGKK